MRHELQTTIEIDAAPSTVFSQLIDLATYGDWNPFITEASGTMAVGGRLRLHMEPPGGRPMTFRPTVTELVPGRVLEWLGRLGPRGIFDGRHRFELMPTDTGTRLLHGEQFSGVLVPLLRRSLDGPTLAGFEAMNAALARRAADVQIAKG